MIWLIFLHRFDTNGDEVLDLEEFTALVWAMDKTVDESDVLEMFQQALDLTAHGDHISKVKMQQAAPPYPLSPFNNVLWFNIVLW